MDVQAYHGVSGATHQTHVTNLSKAGYGMISLSVYGDPGDAQYAAVWVDRPMPQWSAIHGVDGNVGSTHAAETEDRDVRAVVAATIGIGGAVAVVAAAPWRPGALANRRDGCRWTCR
jgi:hypothetical protein